MCIGQTQNMNHKDVVNEIRNSGRSLEFLSEKYKTTVDVVSNLIDEMIVEGYAITESNGHYAIITYKTPDPIKIGPLLTEYSTRFSYGIYNTGDHLYPFPGYAVDNHNTRAIFCMGCPDEELPVLDGLTYYILGSKSEWDNSVSTIGISPVLAVCNSRNDFVYLGYISCEVMFTSKYIVTLDIGQQNNGGTIYEIDINKDGNVVGMKSNFVP